MTRGVASHGEGHGGDHVLVDVFTTLEAYQARKIMEEVRMTALTYRLLEATNRDDIPAFQCADCEEKLTALDLGTHLKVHGAKTYRIDTRLLISPHLVEIGKMFEKLGQLINKAYLNSRERSLALTKLETSELWLTKCQEVEHPGYLVRSATEEVAP
jgi:hypothetical protein